MENRYSAGKIYKLYKEGDENMCYIGSTIESLTVRFAKHKCSIAPGQNQTTCSIFFTEGNEPLIKLVEEYPCESKRQLEERERYWIEQHPQCVKNIPTQSWKERWEKNKERNAALHKLWIETHKEQEQAKRKERDAKNADALKAYNKAYNEKNKEAIKAKKAEKAECPNCKAVVAKRNLKEHQTSMRCKNHAS